MAATVLVIEDHIDTSRLLSAALKSTPEYFETAGASTGRAGLRHIAGHPVDCVLLDYHLPDMDGLECLREIRQSHPDLPVIIITGSGSEEVAVEAMKLGVNDYVAKHGAYLARIPLLVREVLGRRELARAAAHFQDAVTHQAASPLLQELRQRYQADEIIGKSDAIGYALLLAERAAESQVTVFLEGETGTGKELFARAIHRHGPRADGPFLAHNCATIPEGLLESELFGHVRGAFTGADRQHRGLFDQASGGTLFLDEVSEASPTIQAKLLRVLQDGAFRPVGSNEHRRADVRLIAASNRDLWAAVQMGVFRADLYHRLHVFPIRLPPLRERREDIKPLVQHFLRTVSAQEGKKLRACDANAQRLLESYAWPGNVRELQNEIHRLVLCAPSGQPISANLLSPWIRQAALEAELGERPLKDIIRGVELATIRARLREHGYNRTATARSLGISREALWAKLRQLGFSAPRRSARRS